MKNKVKSSYPCCKSESAVASPRARWLSLRRFCSSWTNSDLFFIVPRLIYTLAIIIWSRIKRTVESVFSFSFSFLQILYFPKTAESTDLERSMAAVSSLRVASSSCFTKSAARFSRRFSLNCYMHLDSNSYDPKFPITKDRTRKRKKNLKSQNIKDTLSISFGKLSPHGNNAKSYSSSIISDSDNTHPSYCFSRVIILMRGWLCNT